MNYADNMAYIESKGGRPVTREEMWDFMEGKPIYPGEMILIPVLKDDISKEPDWIQVGTA